LRIEDGGWRMEHGVIPRVAYRADKVNQVK
jgi:hypothetical protein